MRTMMALLLIAMCGSLMAAPRGFEVRDLVMLDRVSDPQVSPDGRRVAFTLRETDRDNAKGVSGIFLLDLTAPDTRPVRMTAMGMDSKSPRWSLGGEALFFLSSRSGSMQVWRLDLGGGEARQVTDYPVDVASFRLAPAADALALSMDVFPDCVDLACTRTRLDERAAAKTTGVLFDRLFIRHWDTWKDGTRSQLFTAVLDTEGRAAAQPVWVTRGVDGDVPSKPFGDDSEYAFSPDGKQLAYSVRIAGKTEAWSTNFDIYLTPSDGLGEARNLTAMNSATDTGPVFSADGRTLYYRAMRRPGFEADRLAIKALDLRSGDLREIAPHWDRSAQTLMLSTNGRLLYTSADDLGRVALFGIDLANDKVTRLTDAGTVAGFDLAGRDIVFARDDLASPADLYRVPAKGGSPKRLTNMNRDRLTDVRMGSYEQFSFDGWNGEVVHGYVVRPWDYVEGQRYPLAFLIHGGPQGSFGDHFHYRWNPQTYAGQGFVSVMIDFHGSTGYGQAFTDSISGDWGGKPLEDLKKGLAFALEQYSFIDGERACALGASYGGYMVNWIAGNWNEPFRCLVNHDGILDNRFMTYSTEELWFDEWEMGGTAYDKPENFERHNPINHVGSWRVPMLVVHGALDFRVPLEQGIATFTALQRRGIASQFLYFPDENHWVLKPDNSIQWHDTVNAWIKRWTDAGAD